MAPVIHEMQHDRRFNITVVTTGQHREMLDQVLEIFDITPEVDLGLMVPGAPLAEIHSRALNAVAPVVESINPHMLVVQGDTTTAMAAATVGFYQSIPVAHLEAGLRTQDIQAPFPEEFNRVVISRIASLHLAPTPSSRRNLIREGVRKSDIVVTGNTVIDALFKTLSRGPSAAPRTPRTAKHRILVTAHRRESWHGGLEQVARTLRALVDDLDGIEIEFPMHRNPVVREAITLHLGGHPNVELCEPLSYPEFCAAMARSTIIVTDSGGVQEEAPSLGIPVLVTRDNTERPEAVEAGTVRLVGTDPTALRRNLEALVNNTGGVYEQMSTATNPYGDGRASPRVAAAIGAFFGLSPRLPEFGK